MIRFLLLLLIVTSEPLNAQTARWFRPGDRIRIQAEQMDGEFTVLEVESDKLVVRRAGNQPLPVPISSLSDIEVYRGFRSFGGQGAWIGAVAGTVGGMVLARDQPDIFDFGAISILAHGVIGGLGGAFLGYVVGSSIRLERWIAVPLNLLDPLTGFLSGRRTLTIGYSYSF